MLEKTNDFFNAFLWKKHPLRTRPPRRVHPGFYGKIRKGDGFKMHMSRRLGIAVFCMVPAIIGGGILYGIFGSYVPVAVFEMILGFFAIGFFSK